MLIWGLCPFVWAWLADIHTCIHTYRETILFSYCSFTFLNSPIQYRHILRQCLPFLAGISSQLRFTLPIRSWAHLKMSIQQKRKQKINGKETKTKITVSIINPTKRNRPESVNVVWGSSVVSFGKDLWKTEGFLIDLCVPNRSSEKDTNASRHHFSRFPLQMPAVLSPGLFWRQFLR